MQFFFWRFDEILWDFYANHFQAYMSKLKAIILMNSAWDSHANVLFIPSSSKNSLLNGIRFLWDLKILRNPEGPKFCEILSHSVRYGMYANRVDPDQMPQIWTLLDEWQCRPYQMPKFLTLLHVANSVDPDQKQQIGTLLDEWQ